MKQQSNTINCPKCGESIDINEILYHKVDEELRKKYDDQLSKEKILLAEQQDKLEEAQKNQDKLIGDAIKDAVTQKEKELKTKIQDEQSEVMKNVQEELDEKSKQLKELNKTVSENEKLKREMDELQDKFEAESQKKISETLKSEREKIRKSVEAKSELELSKQNLLINQLNEQLTEAKRKIEQGSMQVQGEVQELVIEEWLKSIFPLDTIEEIKKGARGADCLQTVNTNTRLKCGTIYYESKRTKGFQPTWIEKFKNDIREKGADIGVLVTESMPPDMDRLGMIDGVWVCSYNEFKGLSNVLRQSIISISNAMLSQENKGDKMTLLYDYLTGNEFRYQVEAILEGFTQMQSDLESEKRSLQSQWKKREKQLQKVLVNTTDMYSSIKGIAGNAIQSVKFLELPKSDEIETE